MEVNWRCNECGKIYPLERTRCLQCGPRPTWKECNQADAQLYSAFINTCDWIMWGGWSPQDMFLCQRDEES